VQSRKATLQVLSPATASQGSTSNQRTQSFSIEECAHATNGNGTADTYADHPSAQPATADGELFMIIDVYSCSPFWLKIQTFSIISLSFSSCCSRENYNSLLARSLSLCLPLSSAQFRKER
jgi:hypothetical protein